MRKVKWKNWYEHINWAWIGQRHLSPTIGAVAMSVPMGEWDNLQAFQDFIRSNHTGDILIEHLYTAWIDGNTETSQFDDRYSYGFPHAHNNGRTACAIVIQVPDEGGMTTVQIDPPFGHTSFVAPVAGSGCIIESDELHGVLKVSGGLPRIAVIAQYLVL